ncbi:hypothetical protein WUBG_15745 [Wuchereria bancrofti]|uniref:Uncharacterized protein n=1 Tax=Wuchereria bancrofti TaxID=6293 RepID=J9AGV6_WUCBA|nr:hypothetical protein WUBG_15745 [Wuchereria bancrofti]
MHCSFGKSSDFNAYATLAPMSATPSYVGTMKIEPLQDQLHSTSMQHSSHPSGLDKLSSGPAGLLSPLQTTARPDSLVCSSLLSAHQNGGRASEMLAGLRRHHPYIKEEKGEMMHCSFGKSSDFNAYATLAPMSATPSYVGTMKIEPLQDQLHSTSMQHSSHPSGLDKLR